MATNAAAVSRFLGRDPRLKAAIKRQTLCVFNPERQGSPVIVGGLTAAVDRAATLLSGHGYVVRKDLPTRLLVTGSPAKD